MNLIVKSRGLVVAFIGILASCCIGGVHVHAAAAPPGAYSVSLTVRAIHTSNSTSSPEIDVVSTLQNSTDQTIEYPVGCGVEPRLVLRDTSSAAAYSAAPLVSESSQGASDCHTTSVTVPPHASSPIAASYRPVGYTGAASVLAQIPSGTYSAFQGLTYTIMTGSAASRYRRQPNGTLVDSFVTIEVNSSPLITALQLPAPSSPGGFTVCCTGGGGGGGATASVLVIDYDQNSGCTGDGSANLTNELINQLNLGSMYHNANVGSANIAQYGFYRECNAPPGTSTGAMDIAAIFSKYGVCSLAAQGVQFVWVWANGNLNPHGTSFEYAATGRYTQTWGSNMPTCANEVEFESLNVTRTEAEAQHSTGHYMEAILQTYFGGTHQSCTSGTGSGTVYDDFDGQAERYSGCTAPPLNTTSAHCGDVHFPPNTTSAYDYGNSTAVKSDCANFNPGQPATETYSTVNANTWETTDPCSGSSQSNSVVYGA